MREVHNGISYNTENLDINSQYTSRRMHKIQLFPIMEYYYLCITHRNRVSRQISKNVILGKEQVAKYTIN